MDIGEFPSNTFFVSPALNPDSPLIDYFTTVTDTHSFPSVYDDVANDENITKFQFGGETKITNLEDLFPGASDWPDMEKL